MMKRTAKSNDWSRERMVEVGQIFRRAREHKRWTLRQLEAECGLRASRVNKLENGLRVNPDFLVMRQLLDVLKPINLATGQTFTMPELEALLQQTSPKLTVLQIPPPGFELREVVQVWDGQKHRRASVDRRFYDVDRQEWLYRLDGLVGLFPASDIQSEP